MEKTTTRSITTDNEILFTSKLNFENGSSLSLCKQSYSDGNCFYTLKNQRGFYSIEHAHSDINAMIKQVEKELKISQKDANRSYNRNNPQIKAIHDEVIRWKKEILTNLKKIAQGVAI